MGTLAEQKAWLMALLRALDMACWRNAEEGRDFDGWASATEVAAEVNRRENMAVTGQQVHGGLHALNRAGWVEFGRIERGILYYAPTEKAADMLLKLDTR